MTQTPLATTLEELDGTFLEILSGLKSNVTQAAARASEAILASSSGWVSSSARDALVNFHKLYTSGADAQTGTLAVNRDVDDLFDQVKAQVDQGGVDAAIDVEEDQAARAARYSYSGVQKELEAVIRMDEGLRQRLVPILSNLQFEDALRQRLDHVEKMWSIVIDRLRSPEDLDPEIVGYEMAALTTSVDERTAFYKLVLKSEPPPEANVADVVLFDL